MSNPGAFERDVQQASEALASARTRAFWIRLLTLGILDGSRGVAAAQEHFRATAVAAEQLVAAA